MRGFSSYSTNPRTSVKVIGLTGRLGAGKGEVASILETLGATILNADVEAHQLYKKDSPAWLKMIKLFGRNILTGNGEIDRAKLAQIVFSEGAALKQLNELMHPLIRERITHRLSALEQGGTQTVILEAPLLLEAGWTDLVNEVWLVTAPKTQIFERLKKQRNLSRLQIEQRFKAQRSEKWKATFASTVIENDGSYDALTSLVTRIWNQWIEERN